MTKKTKNKFEERIFKLLKRKKVSFKYESEKIPYVLAGHYIPDFVVEGRNGRIYIETKGYLRPEHKRKMVAVKRQHPELDIRILFYSNKTKDIKWASKNGFIWAVDTIPEEWYDGLF